MNQKTTTPKVIKESDRKWFVVDAKDKILGRLATEIAVILRGKNKPTFTPHMDLGDYVVVINADKVRLTGQKESTKEYITHSGYLGHIHRRPIAKVRQEKPTMVLEEAVKGMLPNNRLRSSMMDRLKLYTDESHPHAGQNPTPINL